MGGWGDGGMGKRLKVKGKRNQFNLYPLPLSPFPFPMPHAPCPMPNAPCPIPHAQYPITTTY
ncbi:hypothetical protein [Nostoc linckia]|uniref:hypothetical protein n=2 Tax=Nostoc linckia TaxID=92942 RepID=UPI00117E14C9|nr:hypothetical protein [Nostoc linckia]